MSLYISPHVNLSWLGLPRETDATFSHGYGGWKFPVKFIMDCQQCGAMSELMVQFQQEERDHTLAWTDAQDASTGKKKKSSLSSLSSIVLIFLKSMVLGLGTAEASRNFLEIWILRCLPNVHNQPQGHTFLTLFPRDSNRPNVYELLSYGSVSLFHLDCFSAKLCSSYKLAYANRNVLNIYIFYSCISLNTQRNLRH